MLQQRQRIGGVVPLAFVDASAQSGGKFLCEIFRVFILFAKRLVSFGQRVAWDRGETPAKMFLRVDKPQETPSKDSNRFSARRKNNQEHRTPK